jgi:hypothetical protein
MTQFGRDYQVARSTGVCAASGSRLEPGASCIATLCEREGDEGFERKDYSIESWQDGARPDHLFSFWRTDVASADDRRAPLVDDEVLIDLFHRLADDERQQRMAFRFVLMLILMRKRKLRFVGRQEPSGNGAGEGEAECEQWLVRQVGTSADEPPLAVTNPRLDEDDIRDLTEQLREILQSEW